MPRNRWHTYGDVTGDGGRYRLGGCALVWKAFSYRPRRRTSLRSCVHRICTIIHQGCSAFIAECLAFIERCWHSFDIVRFADVQLPSATISYFSQSNISNTLTAIGITGDLARFVNSLIKCDSNCIKQIKYGASKKFMKQLMEYASWIAFNYRIFSDTNFIRALKNGNQRSSQRVNI